MPFHCINAGCCVVVKAGPAPASSESSSTDSPCRMTVLCPSRIGLFDVSQLSIAQGRTKSIAEVVYCGRDSSAVLLPHVMRNVKIIANLKQTRKIMIINAIMNISTNIAISKIRTITAIINS
jgi:hypothetical protein